MTNLEYIRTLSAEELAKWHKNFCSNCPFTPNSAICHNGSCMDRIVEWLNQEHKTEIKPCPFCGGQVNAEAADVWNRKGIGHIQPQHGTGGRDERIQSV